MSEYVFAFRNRPDETADEAAESAWAAWFAQLGDAVANFGHRVGRAHMVGDGSAGANVLSGYVVINAASLDDAVALAQGCPGLKSGGQVEVGETVAM
jgi:hypothetical protein